MLFTKAALVLLVAVLGVSCVDHKSLNANPRPGSASTIPQNLYNDNTRYPEAVQPFNGQGDGQRRAVPKPQVTFGSVTIQKDNTYAATPDSSNYYGSITKVDCVPGRLTSSSHTPTSSDSKITRVPETTVDEDPKVILRQNHLEVMNAIGVLTNELDSIKQDLYSLKMFSLAIKRDLERAINISN
uniref:EP2-like n=1 Tax=Cotesia sesamiae Kitale bracovirus TaxID=452648 RepID=S0DKV6_9VIRU|nr:EP2-like [Cotesia sesamiae Kitale bracovirus]